MPRANIEMLQIVAIGLGDLKEEIVLVGGSVAEFYANDPAVSDIRPTQGIECALPLGSDSDRTGIIEDLIIDIANVD